MTEASTTAILLAAGSSERMDGIDKLWASLRGEPLIAHSLRMLASVPAVDVLVVVAPAERHEALCAFAANLDCELRGVEGGARRQDSVAAGIAAAPGAGWYLVHDGARPLATAELARRVLDAAREHGAAVPALPLADTLKRLDPDGRVIETVDRSELWAVQTPQAFAGDLLRRAHAREPAHATDDAALVERLGEPVATVPGEVTNIKITTPADLDLARALLALAGGDGREGSG